MVDFRKGVVSILGPNEGIVGTGFVADARIILSCAHVVVQAGSGPGQTVVVRFHHSKQVQEAQVDPGTWQPSDADDIAVLRLLDGLPAGVVLLPLGSAKGCDGHPFRAFGYPPLGHFVGIWASGAIIGLVYDDDDRQMMQLSSPNIAKGSSGAPVFDQYRQQVVGMVTLAYYPGPDAKHRETAFAVPTETILQVCPELAVMPHSPPANLFFVGGAVPPYLFVGRRSALALIQSRLDAPTLQSVSIVGERRIGKSSLLCYVRECANDLFSNTQPVIIYLDLMKAYCHTRKRFVKALRRELTRALGCEPWSTDKDGDLGTLSVALEDLSRDGVRLVLLLDEVEKLTKRREEFDDLLEELRAAGQLGQVGLLTASARPLADLCRVDGLNSPFYNIFMDKVLGLLTETDWHALVRDRMPVTEAELASIERLAGGHPFYTQVAAWNLWETHQGVSDSDWETRTLEAVAPHWAHQWQGLLPNEQATLRFVAGLPGPKPSTSTLRSLTRRGMLRANKPFCAAYGEWLKTI